MQDTKDEARSCALGCFEACLQMSGAACCVTSWQDVFKQYDDGDGVLSRDELKRMQADRCVVDELIPRRVGMLKEETSKLAEAVSSVWSDSKRALGDSPCAV